jgi:hypothetical protein
MSKNSLPATRQQINEQSLTGVDRVVSYLGWHALELLGIGGVAVLSLIFGSWVWLLALVPLGYGAWHDLELHRNNTRERQRRLADSKPAAPVIEDPVADEDEGQDDDDEAPVTAVTPVDLDAVQDEEATA